MRRNKAIVLDESRVRELAKDEIVKYMQSLAARNIAFALGMAEAAKTARINAKSS